MCFVTSKFICEVLGKVVNSIIINLKTLQNEKENKKSNRTFYSKRLK